MADSSGARRGSACLGSINLPLTAMVVEVLSTVHQLLLCLEEEGHHRAALPDMKPGADGTCGEAPARLFPGSESHHSPQSLPFLITIPPKPGKCQLEPLTKDSSFPPAMATADSRAPVVEKVQQLPQAPCKRIRVKPGHRTDLDSDST